MIDVRLHLSKIIYMVSANELGIDFLPTDTRSLLSLHNFIMLLTSPRVLDTLRIMSGLNKTPLHSTKR